MNRRQFLTAAGTIVASAVTGGFLYFRRKSKPQPVPQVSVPVTAEPGKPKPFRVALLSDVHMQPEMKGHSNIKLGWAVDELTTLNPDLWIVNGDIADHGAASEFEAFKQIMAKPLEQGNLMVTAGNHEFYDMDVSDEVSVNRFQDAFVLKTPYTNRMVSGVHIIMLAQEQCKSAPRKRDWCWISAEQMRWFESVLTEHRDTFTCVFMHQPLNETVASSYGADAFGGTNRADEIYALLKQHPQVKLWFSGHTHRSVTFENQVVKKDHTTFVGLGSTFYMLMPPEKPGDRFKRDSDASQTRVMEIYPDKIELLARDHANGKWLDDCRLTIPRV